MSENANPSPVYRDTSGFGGHPKGLNTLFFTEMWERFSYYGMRAVLLLFMVADPLNGGLGFDTDRAARIYGLYTAAVYMTGLPGGWIADRILGLRRAVFWGGVIIAAGHFSMAVPGVTAFYAGLSLIVIGTGLLKPNISAMVGELYETDDDRRDAGFSLYYMGINIGAFLAPLICGTVAQKVDWHLGFALAGIGMVCGLIQYTLTGKRLGDAGIKPGGREAGRGFSFSASGLLWLTGLAMVIAALALPTLVALERFGVLALGSCIFIASLYVGQGFDAAEKRRGLGVFFFFWAAVLFWSGFEQAGSSLNLFADRLTNLDLHADRPPSAVAFLLAPAAVAALMWIVRWAWLRFKKGETVSLPKLPAIALLVVLLAELVGFGWLESLLGGDFPSSWFQSLNPIYIIFWAPWFSWLWIRLGDRQPSSPAKFAFGLYGVGFGFLIMVAAATLVTEDYRVSPMWLVMTYLLHTLGELCLSPVGLSVMTKLAPKQIVGQILGVWFLAASIGNYMGGEIAALFESFPLPQLFGAVAAVSIGFGIVVTLVTPLIRKQMGGVR